MAFNKNCLKKVERDCKCFVCGKSAKIEIKDNWMCQDCYSNCCLKNKEKILKNKQKDK